MQLSSAIVDFNSFYDRPVDMQTPVLLTRSQCSGVFDIQVTVKAHVPLVSTVHNTPVP